MENGRWMAMAAALSLGLGCGCTAFKRLAYEGFFRDRWQQPDRVIESLGLEPGDRVADLGAGGGYFTFRLSDAVEPAGKVYAVDVDAGMIDYLDRRASEEGRENVEVVLAKTDDPLLPEAGVDLIFTCNTYHHIDDRPAYFRNAARYLRPGGRLAIVEYKPGWLSFIFPHDTPGEVIRAELEGAGYQLESSHDFLSRQSFLVFAPTGK